MCWPNSLVIKLHEAHSAQVVHYTKLGCTLPSPVLGLVLSYMFLSGGSGEHGRLFPKFLVGPHKVARSPIFFKNYIDRKVIIEPFFIKI